MNAAQKWLLAVNVIGGIAVIGSYFYGFQAHPAAGEKLWGQVPAAIRPWYTVSMLLAALGYFALLPYLFFGIDAGTVSLPGGFGIFFPIFVLILLPSSLWMPLTFAYAGEPGLLLWCLVRGVLFLVAFGSLALVVVLVIARPETTSLSWILAVVGSAVFAFHTTVLDALVWPVLYRR